jgi:hypothetical protein
MSLETLIADLEAQLLFASARSERGRSLANFGTPSRLEITQRRRKVLLQPGFVAKNFVVGIPVDPSVAFGQARSAGRELIGPTLWLAPLAALSAVRMVPTLIGGINSNAPTAADKHSAVALANYLRAWVGEQILIGLARPSGSEAAANFGEEIELCDVSRHALLVAGAGGEMLIPVSALDWLALGARD